MACFVGNEVFTVEGINEKRPDKQKHLLNKIVNAVEKVELCEHCYPKLGEEISVYFEDVTIKINLKNKQVFVTGVV